MAPPVERTHPSRSGSSRRASARPARAAPTKRRAPAINTPRSKAGAKADVKAGTTKAGTTKGGTKATNPSPRPWPVRALRFSAYWGTVLGLWAFLAVAGVVAWYGAQLPSADTWVVPERGAYIRLIDMHGKVVAHRGVHGKELTLTDISPHLPKAVIAIEDHRFRSHFGFDPVGFSRAMYRNVAGGRMREGGSTITQQLAKNLFLSPERTFGRKVQELILAVWLEAKFSKDEILELYLNRVYFGSGAYGADAAARTYYGVAARDLNLMQSATLAGLLKAPSRLSPKRNPRGAAARAALVLAAMEREGFVSGEQAKRAAQIPARTVHGRTRMSDFVADMAVREVKNLLGRIDRDVDVRLTLDMDLQRAAARAVFGAIGGEGRRRNVKEGALVAMAPDGALRALVGGRDYRRSQFNRAATAKRQPGSAFKPFVWLAALEAGLSPASAVKDTPLTTGRYRPRNHGERYRGDVTLSQALSTSSNTVAVRLARKLGARKVAATAKRLGIGSKLARNHALALGASEVTPLELTAAYAPFANGGRRVTPHLVSRITSDGKLLYDRRSGGLGPRVVGARDAATMSAMLSAVVARGTGKAAAFDHPAAGKTGTTQGGRDAWFVGLSAHLVTGVWFGNDDASPTKASGGGIAARAWSAFMAEAHEGLPKRDIASGMLTHSTTPTERPGSKVKRGRPSFIDRLLNR